MIIGLRENFGLNGGIEELFGEYCCVDIKLWFFIYVCYFKFEDVC